MLGWRSVHSYGSTFWMLHNGSIAVFQPMIGSLGNQQLVVAAQGVAVLVSMLMAVQCFWQYSLYVLLPNSAWYGLLAV
jgi:hypothetical protein